MIVYIEYVFINNLIVNLVICYIALKLNKLKIKAVRLIMVSIIGAIIAVIYPLIAKYNIILRILLSFLMVLLLAKYKSVWEYIVTLAIFYIVTFTFAGGVMMLESSSYKDLASFKGGIEFTPALTAIGVFVVFILMKFFTKEIYIRKNKSLLEYKTEISTEFGKCEVKAFYDSGNCLYNENQPVIIISDNLYNQIKGGEEDLIGINTLSGKNFLKLIKVRLVIYIDDNMNKIFNVNAGVSDKIKKDFDVILHADMIGE